MTNFDYDLTLDHARAWEPAQWASWFVTAFSTNYVAPFRFHPEATIIDEIDRLFIAADEYTRRRMRDGIVQAVREWHPDLYEGDYRVLRLLSRTAARIRATDVIPHLVRLVMANYSKVASGLSPFFTVADDLVSVLAGFAPDSRIEHLFDLLLFDDDVTPKLAALLAIGLCRCNPARFADCFERFWVRRSLVPRYFIDRHIIKQFEKVVTPAEMTRSIADLRIGTQEYFFRSGADAHQLGPKDLIGFDTPDPTDDRGLPVNFNTEREVFKQAAIRYGVAVEASSKFTPAGKRTKEHHDVWTTEQILNGMIDHAAMLYLDAGVA